MKLFNSGIFPKTFLSFLLVVLLVSSMLPVSALAAEDDNATPNITVGVSDMGEIPSEGAYEVSSYEELLGALSAINAATDDAGIIYTIKLTSDIFPPNNVAGYSQLTLNVEKDTTIFGNGHKLFLGDGSSGEGMFFVRNDATLSFGSRDGSTDNLLTIQGSASVVRANTLITIGEYDGNKTSGTCNIYDGVTLQGIASTSPRDASVCLVKNGTFNLYGGLIQNNGTPNTHNGSTHGIIAHDNASTSGIHAAVNIYGGKITNNYSNNIDESGGNSANRAAVVMNSSAQNSSAVFNMYGGEISNHKGHERDNYGSRGGALSLRGANVTGVMTGGKLANNTAYTGAGISLSSGASFTMSGGEISDNTAYLGGGGVDIYFDKATFTMTGGTINNNTVSEVKTTNSVGYGGGGIQVESTGVFNLEGGLITENSATGAGGGVKVNIDGTFIMSGGIISSNKAANSKNITTYGGGVYVSSEKARFNMSNGTITANEAERGGGVCTNGVTVMDGGTISNNSATYGGGIWVSAISGGGVGFTMNGGVIANNSVNQGGGGVYCNGAFEMNNGSIVSNSAFYGGGITTGPSATARIAKGDIIQNKATMMGAGIFTFGGVTMVSGNLSENEAAVDGGGMYIRFNGSNNIKPVVLGSDNATAPLKIGSNVCAGVGGGIAAYGLGNVNLQNVLIKNNTAAGASGIMLSEATLALLDSEVSGNVSLSTPCGGILVQGAVGDKEGNVYTAGALKAGGSLKVTDNLAVDNNNQVIASNMYLANNVAGLEDEAPAKITIVAPLGADSIIGVTEEQAEDYDQIFFQNEDPKPSPNFTVDLLYQHGALIEGLQFFKSDNPRYLVIASENEREARLADKGRITPDPGNPNPDDPGPKDPNPDNPKPNPQITPKRPIPINKPTSFAPMPKTADNTNVELWLVLACISLLTMMTAISRKSE